MDFSNHPSVSAENPHSNKESKKKEGYKIVIDRDENMMAVIVPFITSVELAEIEII